MSANFNLNSNMVFGTNLFSAETLFNVQTINLPGISISPIKLPSRSSVLESTISSSKLTYSPLVMTIICDEDMKIWKELITNLLKHRDYDGLNANAWLSITNNSGKEVLKLNFTNVVPISVSDMEYSTTNSNEILIFEFEVHYDSYNIDGGADMEDKPSDIL